MPTSEIPAPSEGLKPWAATGRAPRPTLGHDVHRIRERGSTPYFYGVIRSELRRSARISFALAAGSLFQGLGQAALALAAGLIGAALLGQSQLGGQVAGAKLTLPALCFLGLGGAAVKALASILLAFSESTLAHRVAGHFRDRVTRSLISNGLPGAVPQVMASVTVRLREIETAVGAGAVMWVRAVAQLVPLALTLILLSSPWTLFVAVMLIPFGAILAALRRRWRAANERALRLVERQIQETDELARNLDLWRVYGKGDHLLALLADSTARAARAAAGVDAGRAALSGMNEVLGALALLGGVLVAERLGASPGGTWVMALPPALLAYRPLRDLGDARSWCARGLAAAEAVQRDLCRVGSAPERVLPAPPRRSWPLERLELHELTARAGELPTTLGVEPGEMVCVRGATGSGKSSLLAAVLGLEWHSGRVSYGALDLTHAPLGPSARPFAWVPQDAPLVTGSVFDNVALFAASAASARRAVDELGLAAITDDCVGPGGRPLSGGERRLVALGRALATELPVLLLDEPTEGLDPESEQRVMNVLRRIRGTRSVLLVTHRERLAAAADRCVRLGAREA